MAFSEKPPPLPPFDAIQRDPAVLYQFMAVLIAYLERLRASIP